MKTQPVVRRLVAAVVAAFGISGTALAVPESEPNGSLSAAQHLTTGSDGSVTVDGVVGTVGGQAVTDVDFYSFDAKAGDVVTIDIDGGVGGLRDFDSIIFLFGPGILHPISADDAGTLDAGSTSLFDSRIDKYTIPVTGTYTVAVTGVGVFLSSDGSYPQLPVGENGDYTLTVSGLSVDAPAPAPAPAPVPVPHADPVVMQISIDIKPGNGQRSAVIHPHARGEVSVALLSSGSFNVLDVDVSSLKFGATGNEASLKKCEKRTERVNRDRRRDLVCHFKTDLAGFAPGDLRGVLRGKTKDGRAFEGRGSVRVVQRHAHDDDRHGRR